MQNINYCKLSDLVTQLESGGRPKGGGSLTGDIPSLGAEHLNDYGGFNFENMKFVPRDYFHSMNKGIIQKSDILVVKDGATTGKVSIIKNDFPFQEAAVNEHVFIVRINKEKLDAKFLFYFLYSDLGQSLIQTSFHGSAQGGITKSFIDNIKIPLLELDTQLKISSVLEKAESARAKRKQSNRLTDEFLKSVFLEMFGDPVRNPKGWEVKTIGELIEENTLECLDSMRIPLKESDRAKRRGIIPYYGANGLIDYIDGFIFDEHLLLLAEDGGYWEPFTKSSYRINGKSWVNNHSHVLKAKDEPLLYYLEYFLNIVDLRSYISGTTRGKLTQSDMRRIKISLPGPLEQQKFAAIVQKVEKLKQKQRESEKEIDNLFNSLMQKAFKGELL